METDIVEEEICQSINKADLNGMRALFAAHPDYVHRRYRGSLSWINIAVPTRRREFVEALLGLGCDVNLGSWSAGDETPLWVAVGNDDPAMVRLLLANGGDPNRGRMVITTVTGAKRHSLEMLKLLEHHGADLHQVFMNQMTNEPMNAFSSALDWGKQDVVDYLRSKGATLPEPSPKKAVLETLADEIIAYFADRFGPVDPKSLIEIVPTALPAIAIHTIRPNERSNHITLFTTGMSDEPMKAPKDGKDVRFAELFVQLPADWDITDLTNPAHSWPLDWLRSSAQNPHVNDSWLGGPAAIISNDDPPKPLGPGVKFTAVLLMAQHTFVSQKKKKVELYRMVPLYTEERDLEKRRGFAALMRGFDRLDIGLVVDLNRPNAGK